LGQELTATTPLNTQRWIDAAVTLSGTSLVLYVDGTQAAASTLGAQFSGLNGSLYLGNDVTAGNPGSMAFGGFMDMLAIFDAALPQATLQSFVTTPPFIFDEHISALYIGANGNPKNDLISGSTLSFTGDASVKLVENTTFQPTIPPFTFTSKSYSPPSPYYHWEAAAFCDILAENAADSYGLRPRYEIGGGQYPDSMLAFVSAIIMSNPSAQNIVVNRANLTTDALTGACDAVESGGGFSTLFKCLFMDFAIGAATAGTYYYMRAKSKTTAATAAMAVFAAILVTVIPKIVLSPPIKQPDEKPPVIPWPPYRTPKPEYRRGLSLDSISINHGTSGSTSVNIKSGTNTPITAPEWTAAKAVPSRALYIQSDIAVPVWKCAFTYSVIVIGATTPPPPCSVTVDGTSESVIGNFSATLKLPSAGSYSLDVSLSSSTIKTCVIGKYSVKVDWKATFSTGEILPLGTSVFTIYVLPTLPLAPFSVLTGQTSNWVSAPLLDLLATYLNKNMYLVTRAAFAPCVRNDAKFAPADTSVYSTLPDTDLGVPADAAFKLDTLLEAYTTGNISLSALDAALLLALLCRACGTTANLFRLRCGLMKMQGVDGKWLYPTFKLSPSSRLSETTFTEKLCLSEHYVVCASATEDYTANVSDPFYKFKVAAYTVTPDDMPYSNLDTFFVGEADKSLYRESLTQQGQLNALWNVVTQISLN
jgi:hypothetical protein